MALPAVVAVLGVLLWGLAVGVTQLRCDAAARGAALAVARGEAPAAVAPRVLAAVGPRATVAVQWAGAEVRAVVTARVGGGWLPTRTVSATASAVVEPGVAGDAGPSP